MKQEHVLIYADVRVLNGKTLSPWYEVCVQLSDSGGIDFNPARGTLASAKNQVAVFRELYPQAHLIFVKHHTRRGVRVLHRLSVYKGSTAAERRDRAQAQPRGWTEVQA